MLLDIDVLLEPVAVKVAVWVDVDAVDDDVVVNSTPESELSCTEFHVAELAVVLVGCGTPEGVAITTVVPP